MNADGEYDPEVSKDFDDNSRLRFSPEQFGKIMGVIIASTVAVCTFLTWIKLDQAAERSERLLFQARIDSWREINDYTNRRQDDAINQLLALNRAHKGD